MKAHPSLRLGIIVIGALLVAGCSTKDLGAFGDGLAKGMGGSGSKSKRWVESNIDVPVVRYGYGESGCQEAYDLVTEKDFSRDRSLSRFTGKKIEFIEERFDPASKRMLSWNRCTVTYRTKSYR